MQRDIGCDDFEAAARNRKMVAEKMNISAYVRVELALLNLPWWSPLPLWIPTGNLPIVTGQDLEWARRRNAEGVD